MRIRKLIATMAIASMASVTLAACGSSETKDEPGGSTDVSGSGLKGDPIVVGAICSCTGPQAAQLAKSGDINLAWADWINKHGGINGHPVKMIVKDDAADPAKALQAAKELVEKDKIVALVGEVSVADAAFADYMSKEKVPVVGGISAQKSFLTNPDFFTSGASSPVVYYGLLLAAQKAGAKKTGILYCAESPVCADAVTLLGGLSKAVGLGYASGKIAATEPNYTAACQKMKDDGVDHLFIGHNTSVVVRVADDCAKSGFDVTQIGALNTYGPEVAQKDSFDGAIFTAANAVLTDVNIPGVKDFRDAMDDYKAGLSEDPQINGTSIYAWAGGQLFVAAAKAAELGPDSTSADVYKGLYALKNETLDGVAPPLTFAQGKPGFPTCYFGATIKDKKLVASSDEPQCLDADQAGLLGKALAALAK